MANQLTSFCPPRKLVGFFFAALTALFSASAAHATLIDRGGGLIYDDVLDITWLQDTKFAASNTFGLATGTNLGTHPSDTSGFQGFINADGTMNWPGVLFWIDAMNADGGTGYLGFSDWRLPTAAPINGTDFQIAFSNNATTDNGTAKTTTDGTDGGWRDGAGNPVSEMGYMYYVNLSNLGVCTPNDADPLSCVGQPGFGFNNISFIDGATGDTVSFLNTSLESDPYWYGTEFPASDAVYNINLGRGDQNLTNKGNSLFAWAVRSGDVPEPTTLLLLGFGLAGMGVARRRLH